MITNHRNNPPEIQNNPQKIKAHPIPKMNHPRTLKTFRGCITGGCSLMLNFETFLVEVHNRPTIECQFLLIGKLKPHTNFFSSVCLEPTSI